VIGLCNIREDLHNILSCCSDEQFEKLNVGDKFPKLNGVFIDWVDTPNRRKPIKEYAFQAAVVSHYSKKNTPMVIFDRYMSITDKEEKWLKKFNTHLLEPALDYRTGFEYMPYWLDVEHCEQRLMESHVERDIDVGFKGSRASSSFEKYYIEFMRKYPDRVVFYKDDFDWERTKMTVAVDSDTNYSIGHLNYHTVNALAHGCLVIIPEEHKYCGSLFNRNVIDRIEWIDYLIDLSEDAREGAVLDVYNNIRTTFPEFDISNVAERIVRKMK